MSEQTVDTDGTESSAPTLADEVFEENGQFGAEA